MTQNEEGSADQLPPMPQMPQTAVPVWPEGHRLGAFELQSAVGHSGAGIVYRGWDHALAIPVAIEEYLPSGLARRAADGDVLALDAGSTPAFVRGLNAFVDEARILARCDHPALLRVLHLLQAHGTAYRVSPWYAGTPLAEVRRGMAGPPDEAALRSLLGDLLGALEAYHGSGAAHGAVEPARILLLDDDRVLLLGPGLAEQALAGGSGRPPASDFHALAEVARFCISGLLPAGPPTDEPLATMLQRLFFDMPGVRYDDTLLRALDAAASTQAERWPRSAAQFSEWLEQGPPGSPAAPPVPPGLHATADDEVTSLIQRVIESIPPANPAASPPVSPPASPPTSPEPSPAPTAKAISAPAPAPLPPPLPPPPPKTPTAPFEPALRAPPVELAGATPRWAEDRPPAPRRRIPALWAGAAAVLLGLLIYGAWQLQRPPIIDLAAARPLPDSAPVAAAASVAASAAATAEAPPEVVALAAPAAASQAIASEPAASAVAASEPASAAAESAAPAASAAAPVAAKPAKKPPAKTTRVAAGGPREQCGKRVDFALYRCMQQQCERKQWQRHPQCVRLRSQDKAT